MFAAIYALPIAVETGARKWMAVSVAAIAGLIYAYLFYWTALAFAMALWMAWLLIRRDAAGARRLVIIGVLAVVLALPEALVLLRVSMVNPGDVRAHSGLDGVHITPHIAATLLQRLLVMLPFAYVLLPGPKRNRFYIALAFAPLPMAAIEGIIPQPWHYTTRVWSVFALPLFIAGGMEMVRRLPRTYVRPVAGALLAAAVGGFVYVAVLQVKATRQVNAAYSISSNEDAAFTWIRHNVPANEPIVSPSITTNLLLASLTPSSQYLALCCYTTAGDAEISGYFRTQIAFGFDEDTSFGRLQAGDNFPFQHHDYGTEALQADVERYMAYYLLNWEVEHPENIDGRIPEWRDEFRRLQSQSDVLGPYRAGYVYCRPARKTLARN